MSFFKQEHLEVMFDQTAIARRVAELGAQITAHYQHDVLATGADHADLVVVGILKGSFVFLADLARAIDLPCSIEFMGCPRTAMPPRARASCS